MDILIFNNSKLKFLANICSFHMYYEYILYMLQIDLIIYNYFNIKPYSQKLWYGIRWYIFWMQCFKWLFLQSYPAKDDISEKK